ncbi:ParB N-terminal domain-containing protein [Candidatus Gracilibacteria bacterium]|nr:ParB N-terminal domain-containing protein [Candidatus Gracilibacteria bacterium]
MNDSHFTVNFLNVTQIFPHEEIDEEHLVKLEEKMRNDGLWKKPIVVDRNTKVILDGHHRWHIAQKIGLKTIPVVEWDIFDENIMVRPFRKDFPVYKELVLKRGKSGLLLPFKTTKHVWGKQEIPFIEILPQINILFSKLS